jgi:hypothetical protein
MTGPGILFETMPKPPTAAFQPSDGTVKTKRTPAFGAKLAFTVANERRLAGRTAPIKSVDRFRRGSGHADSSQ